MKPTRDESISAPAGRSRSAALREALASAGIALLLGVASTLAASRWVQQEMRRCAEARFEVATANVALQVERRLEAYAEVLLGLRALFQASEVSQERFSRFADALELKAHYPGFQVVNFAPYVPAGSRDAFEKAMQQDPSRHALARLAIAPPGERDGYHPLTLLAPLQGNEDLFGKDIAAAPHVRTALDVARDTGKLATSGRLIPLRGARRQVGLAMRMPIYRAGMPNGTLSQRRAAYLGSVGAGFLVDEMFTGLPGVARDVRVRIYEGGPEPILQHAETTQETSAQRLMFDSRSAARADEPQPPPQAEAGDGFRVVRSLIFGDRLWEVEASVALGDGEQPFERQAPLVVLLAGIVISTLLSGTLGLVMARRHTVVAAS